MSNDLDNLLAQWTRLGAGFEARPAPRTPDLERLLLETARHAPRMARLFIMSATWLHRYGDLVARSRLSRLIRAELPAECRPILALLLDVAHQGTRPLRFQSIIRAIPPAAPPRPLFEVERATPRLIDRARRCASGISTRWGLWCPEIDLKSDALRPPRWVMEQNPTLTTRADFRGDLRSSILASLRHDPDAGESEYRLARVCGGSRTQVRSSLDNLELTGRVARIAAEGSRRSRITLMRKA